jgi:hypothetical protein
MASFLTRLRSFVKIGICSSRLKLLHSAKIANYSSKQKSRQVLSSRGWKLVAASGIGISIGIGVARISPIPTSPELVSPSSTPNRVHRNILFLVCGLCIAIPLAALPFLVIPWLPTARFGGVPFVATLEPRVQCLFNLLPHPLVGKRLVDLGSGDGRIVIAAAQRGMIGMGVEVIRSHNTHTHIF